MKNAVFLKREALASKFSRGAFPADKEALVAAKAITCNLVIFQSTNILVDNDLESRLLQTVWIILPVNANKIAMAERFLSGFRRGNGGVFIGLLAIPADGHLQDSVAPRFQDAIDLSHCCPVLWNVLQHMRANDNVIGAVRLGNMGDVNPHLSPWTVQIGALVLNIV